MKVDSTKFYKRFGKLDNLAKDAMDDALPFYKETTPIRSGNARKRTRKRTETKIASNYGYAGKLDDGWSKQAPDGFTDPTIDHIRKFIDKTVGKI